MSEQDGRGVEGEGDERREEKGEVLERRKKGEGF